MKGVTATLILIVALVFIAILQMEAPVTEIAERLERGAALTLNVVDFALPVPRGSVKVVSAQEKNVALPQSVVQEIVIPDTAFPLVEKLGVSAWDQVIAVIAALFV